MFKRLFGLVMAVVLSGAVYAAAPVEGQDYVRLKSPQPVATGKKIEVAEFFWYRCPHCFHLEPSLVTWLQKLPKDAQMRRIPAVFNEGWAPAARLYYTLEQMNLVGKLHEDVFDAIHMDNLDFDNDKVLGDWMASKGVDREKFMSLYNSFSMQTRAMQNTRLSKPYELRGVPTFIVDGKYQTSQSMAGSEEKLFATLDALIAKARAERRKK